MQKLTLAFLIFVCCGRASSWEKVFPSIGDTSECEEIGSISFMDKDTGIAIGRFTTALRTTDGGNTWRIISHPHWGDPSDVALLPSGFGVIVGQMQSTTQDGGATWGDVSAFDIRPVYSIQLTYDTLAFALKEAFPVGSSILKSTNSQVWWTTVVTFGEDTSLIDIKVNPAGIGFASASYLEPTLSGGGNFIRGLLFETDDFGENWEERHIDSTMIISHIVSLGQDTFFLFAPNVVMRSVDQGNSFHLMDVPQGFRIESDVLFVNSQEGLTTGGFITTDGGSTWTSSYDLPSLANRLTMNPDGYIYCSARESEPIGTIWRVRSEELFYTPTPTRPLDQNGHCGSCGTGIGLALLPPIGFKISNSFRGRENGRSNRGARKRSPS